MSLRELSRLEVVQRVEAGELSQIAAAERLGLTDRQMRRLQTAYRTGGAPALVSKRRGRPSNNRLSAELQTHILTLLTARYTDFGPTLAREKLAEEHDLHLSLESLRQLMMREGVWKAKRARKPVVHQMRERRAALGELVQIDGSPHAWLEDRGPRCTLLVFIDDATGRVQLLRFVPAEDTWSYFEATRHYIRQHGKPCAFYSDKFSVFRPTARENHQGEAITQFGRAMRELDIEMICANSPQAKGRVERMNQTLQDRLVKELRLRGICDMEQANLFLPTFLESLNRRFSVTPRSRHDAHRKLQKAENLDRILSLQETRVLSKNLTLQYDNVIYQIKTSRPSYALRSAHVLVCQNRDGAVTLLHNGRQLAYEIHHRHTSQARVVNSKEIDTEIDKLFANPKIEAPPQTGAPSRAAAAQASRPAGTAHSPQRRPAKRSPIAGSARADHPWRNSMISPRVHRIPAPH